MTGAERHFEANNGAAERWQPLVAAVETGQSWGQESLYATFGRGLRAFFAAHLRSEDIEDKVHDTMLAVIAALRAGQLREPERLPGFVRIIAQRQAAGYIDEAVRRRSDFVELETDTAVKDQQRELDRQILLRERRRAVEKAMEDLPQIDRQILVLFYFEEQPAEEICRRLQLSATQFRLRKNRAKSRIEEAVKRQLKRRRLASKVLMRKQAAAGH